MKRSGNGNADRLNFFVKVGVMLERLRAISFRRLPDTRGVQVHHTHQLHLFYFRVFLGMELAKVSDTDDTDLNFFHLTGNPSFRMLNEMEEMFNLWAVGNFILAYLLYRLLQCQTGTEDDPVGFLQGLQGLL